MPQLSRFKKYVKRNAKKPAKRFVKKVVRKANTQRLVNLIKKVSLKNSETKYTHYLIENQDMNHNSGYLKLNLLQLTQGTADTQSGTSFYACRIGDEVIARGIGFKLWIANKKDRPNVMYRVIIFKYQSGTVPSSSAIFVGANGNKIMDDIDREYVTVVYQKIFNLQVGYSASVSDGSSTAYNREAHN